MTRRTALIVGAGIGGLSAGIALRQAGWQVRVFERATSPRELGFGVGLAPNAVLALHELGVGNLVLSRGFAPVNVFGELRRPNGAVLKRATFPIREALGGPMAIALRPALHGALLEALGSDAIEVSSLGVGFETDRHGVALHLANGRVERGDVLVGADGIGSVIREALHPNEAPPRSSGLVAIRGAVDGARSHLGQLDAVYYLGRGVESMIVRASESGLYWFLSVARQLAPDGVVDSRALLGHFLPSFDETFRAVASSTEELRLDELVDRDPLPYWGRGRVTLLGDAAHPLLPHTGQGAAQAITDAVALGKALSGTADVERALRVYEVDRRPKTAALLRQGRRTARVMRTTNAAACYVREVAIRLAPVKPIVKIFVRMNRRAGTDSRSSRSITGPTDS